MVHYYHYLSLDATIKSKDTYGQTRGLSNLEKKHVGELAIIGLFVKVLKQGGFIPLKEGLMS